MTDQSENIKSNDANIVNFIQEKYNLPFFDLILEARIVHNKNWPEHKVEIATLCSIKTGGCPENCSYCPQSAHYSTGIEKSKLSLNEVIAQARQAKENGAKRFCMGAAWRSLHDRDLPEVCEMIAAVKQLGLNSCATFGMLTKSQAQKLKDAGLDYYNHNIDSSDEFYDKIITTRTFKERMETIKNVQEAEIKVCCGGILGMGETIQDRLKMIAILSQMNPPPESVPINQLIPIEGTPLEDRPKQIDFVEFVRLVAVARIFLPKSFIRLSAGRESMTEELQALCFFTGANSIFYGEKLLTAPNSDKNQDLAMLEKFNLSIN